MNIVLTLVILISLLFIYFKLPYSPVRRKFKGNLLQAKDQVRTNVSENGVFTKEDFKDFPFAIQKFIESSGYLGQPKMACLEMVFNDVPFVQGQGGRTLKIDYHQYNLAQHPIRLALVQSSLFGIPFEGYDSYQNGRGGMKGVIGKGITLFNQRGPEMDQACLATYLAESLFVPSSLLEGNIHFEEVDSHRLKATMTYRGQTASGIFTFNDAFEMISFKTESRYVAEPDRSMTPMPWTARCSDYRKNPQGISHPSHLQAIWNYPEGDLVYFDGEVQKFSHS